ncbi:MAG: hypothetical protein KKA67_13505 [Spirochaetes bacterium]|nr:hypothetical protein [Spirochaetota bacterium]MBU1079276.1 hypothetical protein [Spirochaetota bacterium]
MVHEELGLEHGEIGTSENQAPTMPFPVAEPGSAGTSTGQACLDDRLVRIIRALDK